MACAVDVRAEGEQRRLGVAVRAVLAQPTCGQAVAQAAAPDGVLDGAALAHVGATGSAGQR